MGQQKSTQLPEGVTMADAQAEAAQFGFTRQALEEYFIQIADRQVQKVDMQEMADKLKTNLISGLGADSITPTSLALRRLILGDNKLVWSKHSAMHDDDPAAKDKYKQELNEMNSHIWTVTRDGKECEVTGRDLVPGDIVTLKGAGSSIPADGLWVSAQSVLLVDEANLTGESEPVEKDGEKQNILYAGTVIRGGECKMMVLCVGDGSQTGKIFGNPRRHFLDFKKH